MNVQGRRRARAHRTRRRLAAVGLTTAALLAGVSCGGSSEGELSPDAAYAMAVEQTRSDPALSEPIPRETFDSIARTMCEQLEKGGPPDELITTMQETPTQSGKRLRVESVRVIVSTGVRAYCPDQASKLP